MLNYEFRIKNLKENPINFIRQGLLTLAGAKLMDYKEQQMMIMDFGLPERTVVRAGAGINN